MEDRKVLANVIAYSIKRIEMAEFDLNVTKDECYAGEIEALTGVLNHIDILLSGEKKPDEKIKHCMHLVSEVLRGN